MTQKGWLLIAVAIVLGSFSVYLNKDWFAKDDIRIYDRSRPVRGGFLGTRRVADSAANPVVFGFSRPLKLTSVKVVPATIATTNKYAQPVWQLVSESNSVPTKSFVYGMNIRGMHPAIKGAAADPLVPAITYRLLIEAGSVKAQHDFTPVGRGS